MVRVDVGDDDGRRSCPAGAGPGPSPPPSRSPCPATPSRPPRPPPPVTPAPWLARNRPDVRRYAPGAPSSTRVRRDRASRRSGARSGRAGLRRLRGASRERVQGRVEEDNGHLLRVCDVERQRVEAGGGEGFGSTVDLHGAEPTPGISGGSRWNPRTASGRRTVVIPGDRTTAAGAETRTPVPSTPRPSARQVHPKSPDCQHLIPWSTWRRSVN